MVLKGDELLDFLFRLVSNFVEVLLLPLLEESVVEDKSFLSELGFNLSLEMPTLAGLAFPKTQER